MRMKNPILLILAASAIILSSCGSFGVGIEPPTQTVKPTITDTPPTEAVEVSPVPSATTEPEASPTPTPGVDGSQYWTVYQDSVLGFRFALPCFWQVYLPGEGQYNLANGVSYSAYNYPEDYPLSFPRSQIPAENGAIKVEFDIINPQFYGLPPGSSLREFLTAENSGEESEILEITDEEINGQPAVSATIHYTASDITSRYYMIKVNDDFFLRISVAPSSKILNTPDLEGILNSITIDPNAEVVLPTHIPAAPPIGLAAPCIPDYAVAVVPTVDIPEGNTACGLDSFKSLETLTGTVEEYLQNRNTGGLRWEYLIHDPILVGYWQSEGAFRTPDEFATELANSLYAAGEPGGMTFTSDPAAFPALGSTAPESLVDPAADIAQVVYSEGWGLDKLGAAILYFAQDECGGYYWYGLVFSPDHFGQ
jgi:hypothetical protein